MTAGITFAFCNHTSGIRRDQIIKICVFRIAFRADYISHDISITLPGGVLLTILNLDLFEPGDTMIHSIYILWYFSPWPDQ